MSRKQKREHKVLKTFKNLPFISVVIPTCNRASTLVECISSIKKNKYPHFEIIIVDQSSGNESKDLYENKYSKDKNMLYIHSSIKCSSDSRNKGWKKAKGEIVAFIDDDAIAGKIWLQSIANAFLKAAETVGIVGGRIIPVFESPRPSWLPPERDFLLPAYDLGEEIRLFPKGDLPITVNAAFRRSVLEDVGGFDTRLGLKKDADYPYIGGEDSFIGKQVLEKGYTILYYPSAQVFHPVASERLKKSFFLKREFREGVTTIALENFQNLFTRERLSGHMNYHLKRIYRLLFVFIKDFLIPKTNRSKTYMLTASKIAFSIGVIKYLRYLKNKNVT